MNDDHLATGWHTSSHSAQDGACVEQGVYPNGDAAVRDTKHQQEGDIITFSPDSWNTFTASL